MGAGGGSVGGGAFTFGGGGGSVGGCVGVIQAGAGVAHLSNHGLQDDGIQDDAMFDDCGFKRNFLTSEQCSHGLHVTALRE